MPTEKEQGMHQNRERIAQTLQGAPASDRDAQPSDIFKQYASCIATSWINQPMAGGIAWNGARHV
jgi:hypothetical protein